MPIEVLGAPSGGSPPGTCELTSLRGHVLLGGIEGTWTVEIARERHWGARVWPPGGDPTLVMPLEVSADPLRLEEDEDLIGALIWAAQQANRSLRGEAPPGLQRVASDEEWAERRGVAPCKARSPRELGGIECTLYAGHPGPHSWAPQASRSVGDGLDTCGVVGGRAHGCTHVEGHAGPHSWQAVEDATMRCQERPPGPGGYPCGQRVGHAGPHSWEHPARQQRP